VNPKTDSYKEAELRKEFIDPLLDLLGWDVTNKQGYAEAYKEVIHEYAMSIGRTTKAPDYCFRIGGTRKFFLEAKKPSINVKDDPNPSLQLRRYGWSAKLPLCILTNFEDWAIFDTRIRPKKDDSASAARVQFLRYADLPRRWDVLYRTFSKEAVLRGSFDRYAESERQKKGTSEVDDAFLNEIEGWRDELAKNVALRNLSLSHGDLNFAVQSTIDRLIFLRICEDRGIETYGRLQRLLEGNGVYERLKEYYRLGEERYNSGLFHFTPERGRAGEPDTFTPSLVIDDRILKSIIRSLYYPESPYEFSILPTEVLGQVYEQFLGKIIRLTAGHRAVVEERPEVKKAGGVFYTPAYIVRYVVRAVLSKLLDGKTPKDVADLRVLDPACGSGSFLIGAFQYLLDWHLNWYTQDGPKKHKKEIFQGSGESWLLTAEERKRILLTNIYGVDIDSQAVEVTKLSLLLKVLEQVSGETIDKNQKLFHQRALPDLDNNIKCGNSLIESKDLQQLILDEEQARRVNPLDWRAEFPQILEKGGFDAIIGNPPYVRVQTMNEWAPLEVELFKKQYITAAKGNYDIYVVFVERGLRLLKPDGRLGYILPHKFFTAQYGQPLRSLISANKYLEEIVHFGDIQVFRGATTYTCLLTLSKAGSDFARFLQVRDLAAWRTTGAEVEATFPSTHVTASAWNFSAGGISEIVERMSQVTPKLDEVAQVFVGTQTSADDVFVLNDCHTEGKLVVGTSQALQREVSVEVHTTKLFLRGKEIRRFAPLTSTSRLICPYEIGSDSFRLYTPDELMRNFRLTWEYLQSNKQALAKREKGKFKGANWYAFGYPKSMTLFQLEKIVVPDYNNVASFTMDRAGHFYKTGYGLLLKRHDLSAPFLVGLLNSKLMFEYLRAIGTSLRGGYVRFWRQYVEQLPIKLPETGNERSIAGEIEGLANQLFRLNEQLAATRAENERRIVDRQIVAAGRALDQLVYRYYGLNEAEITKVEEASQRFERPSLP
jgi:methylase of polypeptide subunit release factors